MRATVMQITAMIAAGVLAAGSAGAQDFHWTG